MHTVDLNITFAKVTLTENLPDGALPIELVSTLDEFISGALHDKIRSSMNESVLPEALASAQIIKKAGHH